MSGRSIKARFLACPTSSAQDRIRDRRTQRVVQDRPISRIRHVKLRFLPNSTPKFRAARRKLTQNFSRNCRVLTPSRGVLPPGQRPIVLFHLLEDLAMKTPVETNALYLIVAAIPLLHGLDRDFVDPSILMTTAWLLAATFAACHLLRRNNDGGTTAGC